MVKIQIRLLLFCMIFTLYAADCPQECGWRSDARGRIAFICMCKPNLSFSQTRAGSGYYEPKKPNNKLNKIAGPCIAMPNTSYYQFLAALQEYKESHHQGFGKRSCSEGDLASIKALLSEQ